MQGKKFFLVVANEFCYAIFFPSAKTLSNPKGPFSLTALTFNVVRYFNNIKFIRLPPTISDDNEQTFTTKRLLFYSLFYLRQKLLKLLKENFSLKNSKTRKVKIFFTKIYGCKLIKTIRLGNDDRKNPSKGKKILFYLAAHYNVIDGSRLCSVFAKYVA